MACFSVKKNKEAALKNELDALYSFPNKAALPSSRRYLGFFVGNLFQKMVKIIDEKAFFQTTERKQTIFRLFLPLIKIFIKFQNLLPLFVDKKIKNKFKIIQTSRFNTEIDDLWQRASKDYETIIIRDAKYLNWRYAQEPDNNYKFFVIKKNNKIKGYAVLQTTEEKSGIIIDIFAEKNKDVLQSLIFFIIDYFKRKKYSK